MLGVETQTGEKRPTAWMCLPDLHRQGSDIATLAGKHIFPLMLMVLCNRPAAMALPFSLVVPNSAPLSTFRC